MHAFAEKTHSEDVGDIEYMAPEVYDGDEYNTKADIYSLGILLKQLFCLEIERDYIDDECQSTILISKYNEIKSLYNKMIEETPDYRPDCEEILKNKHIWALNEDEFEAKLEIEKYLEQNANQEQQNQLLYSMIKFLYNRFTANEVSDLDENEN